MAETYRHLVSAKSHHIGEQAVQAERLRRIDPLRRTVYRVLHDRWGTPIVESADDLRGRNCAIDFAHRPAPSGAWIS